MYKGWWLEGADKDAETVVDTAGMVFRVLGYYEDGTLELEVVYEDDGWMLAERPGVEPAISSNYDPAPIEPWESTEPLGFGQIE